MMIKFLLRRMSESRQAAFMKRYGIMLGKRWRNGRQIYTYMYRNLFLDILFDKDDPQRTAEYTMMYAGLEKLNQHLEKEIRSSQRPDRH